MDTLKRVEELERKVEALEDKVNMYEQDKKLRNHQSLRDVKNIRSPTQKRKSEFPIKRKEKVVDKESKKLKEAVVGKYLIGILASILIFIAAVSLVGLVWDSLSDIMKLSTLSLSGITLTILGFILIRKKNNPINSIILGTGAGLMFISILSANMYFNLINRYTAFILIALWASSFMFSYKYIKAFFTTLIAYIGSYIAVLLGLSLSETPLDLLMIIIFTIGIILILTTSSYHWLDKKKQLISNALSILSIITVILWGSINSYYIDSFAIWRECFVGLIFLVYYLLYKGYILMDELETHTLTYIPLGFIIGIITAIGLSSISEFSLITKYFVFILINLTMLLLNEKHTKKNTTSLTKLYTAFIAISLILINEHEFSFYIGSSIIGILLLSIDKLKKQNNYSGLLEILIGFDLLTTTWYVSSDFSRWAYFFYSLIPMILISYLLKIKKENNDFLNLTRIKVLAYTTYIFKIFFFSVNVIGKVEAGEFDVLMHSETVGIIGVTLLNIILLSMGYFKDWSQEGFKLFNQNEEIKEGDSSILFYIVTTILFFMSISTLGESQVLSGRLIEILLALGVTLIQSYSIIKHKKNIDTIGFWLGLKYLVLTWRILEVSFSLNFESTYLSVAGLIIALLSIAYGFKVNIKSLRLYGLFLTIIMVLKFIIVDLGEQNSITRVVALLIGGLICFGISVIYNRLNNKIKD